MMRFLLPKTIGYGRLDSLLQIFSALKNDTSKILTLDWSQVREISPLGYAILACIWDSAVEHQCTVLHQFLKKKFKEIPVIKNLFRLSIKPNSIKPSIHNQILEKSILAGQENTLNLQFMEQLEMKFANILDIELSFSCRLILNELMQNSLDHSGAERYYLYGGLWNSSKQVELHIGVLDLGVTIPAKMHQKYDRSNDLEYLELSLQEGITTRRIRPGGLGLFHTFEHLKNHQGTLTVISREAQLIRYFKNKKIIRHSLKFPLDGTWCMTRFPLRNQTL